MNNTEALGEFRCFMFRFQHFLFGNQLEGDVGESAEQLHKNIVQDGVVVVTAVIDNLHTILDLNGDALYLQLDLSSATKSSSIIHLCQTGMVWLRKALLKIWSRKMRTCKQEFYNRG